METVWNASGKRPYVRRGTWALTIRSESESGAMPPTPGPSPRRGRGGAWGWPSGRAGGVVWAAAVRKLSADAQAFLSPLALRPTGSGEGPPAGIFGDR